MAGRPGLLRKQALELRTWPDRGGSADDIKALVSRLDTDYQAAVKANDAATIERILAEDFLLVTGSGRTMTKGEIIDAARRREVSYERNDELHQTVRVWEGIAVVTALLWEKGTHGPRAFDRKLWFSDIYMCTPAGWRYTFGQSSLSPSDLR